MAKEITWDEFDEKYIPVKNHIDDNASYGGVMFETYGEEYDYVKHITETEPLRVWTVLGDCGATDVVSGWHYVNRLGYIITENPADDDHIDVINEDYEDEEETVEYKRNMVIDDTVESCLNDMYYLRRIVQEYWNKSTDDEIIKAYNDAFADE